MILTCPSCGTQYVVKDGSIPPQGRQVRCASCGHSWREYPADEPEQGLDQRQQPAEGASTEQDYEAVAEPADLSVKGSSPPQEGNAIRSDERDRIEPAAEPADRVDEPLAEAPTPPPIPPEAEVVGLAEAAPSSTLEWSETDDEFSPFAQREPAEVRSRSGIIVVAVALLVIAALAAAFWMLAPQEWRERLGIAAASETPLQLMMTHSDRRKLTSNNELLTVSGRVINPTSKHQPVPPIRAELHSSTGQLVYSWTIPPPARSLPPGGSASFNSAELNVPAGAEELTVTLGQPKA